MQAICQWQVLFADLYKFLFVRGEILLEGKSCVTSSSVSKVVIRMYILCTDFELE